MPRIDWTIAQLGNAKLYTVIDLSQEYHQLLMKDVDKDKTAFLTHRGTFRYKRLPFGLSESGFTFQRAVNEILGEALGKFVLAFIDDLVIFSEDLHTHIKHVEEILKKLNVAGFTINLSKVNFAVEEIKLLGHIIKKGKVYPDPEKVETIKNYPVPKTCKQVQRYLGLVGFYRI